MPTRPHGRRSPALRDQARALLENPAFEQVFGIAEAEIALAWKMADTEKEREQLHAEQRAIERIKAALKAQANLLSSTQ
jgi:hypothetical protein